MCFHTYLRLKLLSLSTNLFCGKQETFPLLVPSCLMQILEVSWPIYAKGVERELQGCQSGCFFNQVGRLQPATFNCFVGKVSCFVFITHCEAMKLKQQGGKRIHRTWQVKNIFCRMYKTVLNCVLSRFYTVTHFQGHQTRTCFCFITRHDPYHTQVWFSFFVL